MIRRVGDADADACVEFPIPAEVEIDGGDDLLFLIARSVEAREGAERTVVFDAGVDDLTKVIARFEGRGEAEAIVNARAVERTFDSGVEGEIEYAELLIDDGAEFYIPGVAAIVFRALVAELDREARADRPFPAFRNAHAGAIVSAHPAVAVGRVVTGEIIEAGFEPVVEAVRDFGCFVQGVIRGDLSIGGILRTIKSEVAVDLAHGDARFDGFRTVDLDFIVILGAKR